MQRIYDDKLLRHKDDTSGSKQNYGSETMAYLINRAEQQSYFKQKELELRKQELALQQEREVQQNLFQQQMIQQQQLMLAMFKKIVDKD